MPKQCWSKQALSVYNGNQCKIIVTISLFHELKNGTKRLHYEFVSMVFFILATSKVIRTSTNRPFDELKLASWGLLAIYILATPKFILGQASCANGQPQVISIYFVHNCLSYLKCCSWLKLVSCVLWVGRELQIATSDGFEKWSGGLKMGTTCPWKHSSLHSHSQRGASVTFYRPARLSSIGVYSH